MNAITELRSLQQHAEAIKNDGEHAIATMSPGDAWAQGDIGIVCLSAVPDECHAIDEPSLQLAPGDTQGSRHCLDSLEGVRLHQIADATPLDGPVIEAPVGCRINHPEHGDVLLPAGVYAIVYQRAYADELRRVQD